MPTVHFPAVSELPPEKREALQRLAHRERVEPDDVLQVHRSKLHWPDYMERAFEQGRYDFKALQLPEMTKQGIHTTISMVNKCDY